MPKNKTMNLLRAAGKAALVTGLLLSSQSGLAETKKPDVASFFESPYMSGLELSPDGMHIAILIRQDDGRVKLGVFDSETKQFKVISGFSNADIEDVHWVNNARLTFSTYESENAPGQARYYPGLNSIDIDGSNLRTLVDRNPVTPTTIGTNITTKMLPGRTFFFDVDRSNNSDDVFVVQPVQKNSSDYYEIKAYRLLKLNTKTGKYSVFERAGDTADWLIDQAGVPRLNITVDNGLKQVYYLDPADEKWRKIAEFQAHGDAKTFDPEYFGADGSLYVAANMGKDTSSIYKFDLAKNEISPEPLFSVKDYDLDESAIGHAHFSERFIFDHSTGKVLGVNYQTDASATLWFDDNMKKIQKAVDALLPNTANMLTIGRSGATKHVLVRAFSDVQPVMYLLYDTDSGKISLLGKSKDHIEPKQMSQQDMVHIKARDGLDIPAYLTLPRGSDKKNLPMVVLVHGGPWVRGAAWDWDPEVQFLASRGYAVLQPEYRGSAGFGQKHLQAGFKQWGLTMQDDVADATKWAIAQGYADPKRICIAGASYGGYATLMGLAKNPELFRCGVEWVGVTDLALRYKEDWRSDSNSEVRNYDLPVLVGDPVKDAEMLKANSPVNIPQKITQPLLMAYGGSDYRVPLAHGEKMLAALKPYNDHVEWIEYPYEGHGWRMLKDNVDFWTRVEKFLDANIGKAQ